MYITYIQLQLFIWYLHTQTHRIFPFAVGGVQAEAHLIFPEKVLRLLIMTRSNVCFSSLFCGHIHQKWFHRFYSCSCCCVPVYSVEGEDCRPPAYRRPRVVACRGPGSQGTSGDISPVAGHNLTVSKATFILICAALAKCLSQWKNKNTENGNGRKLAASHLSKVFGRRP